MTTRNWNKTIWLLAGPIMISNVSVPLLGIVDTAVVGQIEGAHYIGAVAVGAQIFSILYWGFGFLRMGTTGFTAQSLGAKDMEQVRAWLLRAFAISVVVGIALIALQRPLFWGSIALIKPSDQVAQLTDAYYSIRIWGAPAVLMGYALLGWFIGIQNTKAVLLLQLGMNVSNIILDLVFVLGFGWGVEGVAYATVISEVGAAIFGCWLALHHAKALGGNWNLSLIAQWEHLKKLMFLNRDIFLRTLCLQTVFVIITALGARMGDTLLAVNAVLMLFQGFMAYGLDGFAHAVETLSGHAYGARDKAAFKGAVKATTIWALIFSLPFSLVYWLFGGELIDLLTKTEDIRLVAREYLPWMVILPVLSVWSFLLDGIFFGMTRGHDMRNAMLISMLVYIVATSVLIGPYGNHGLWLAFSIFMVARAITLGMRYPAIERSIDRTL
ncbi:MAG: MATE family efflux transporter [Rhodospirillales bacterium]|jgi:multidrug resistance protein, MATE family|nr:MATE family efflux transporter [Rhodospirillales bacterium]